MRPRVVAVVLVVVLAGCSSVAGFGDAGTTETVTPAPVPTPTPTPEDPRVGVAPGVSAEGIFDAEYLLERHVDILGGESYVWVEREHEDYLGDDNLTASHTQRVVVENVTRYHRHVSSVERYVQGTKTFLQDYEVYADGDAQFRTFYRFGDQNRTFRYSQTPAPASRFASLPVVEYRRYLPTENVTVAPIDGHDRAHYEIRGTRSTIDGIEPVEDATIRAVVREDGLIRSLNVSVRSINDGDPFGVRYTSTIDELGDASVAEPGWVESARDRFED